MLDFSKILSEFDPITLDEMDSVKLLERMDSKYVFPVTSLHNILEGMKSDYKLLEICNVRHQRYESLYYDTEDYLLYTKHLNGKKNRYKIRFRRYLDSNGLTYFEIKYKNNKGTTKKKRVMTENIESGLVQKANEHVINHTPYLPENFIPSIWISYSRMTFVNKYSSERLTIDTDLCYKKASDPEYCTSSFPEMVIAEAKREKASSVSQFIRLVRRTGVREGSISKYCFGIYNLIENVPKNNLKPKVRFVYKMAGITNIK